MKWRRRLSVRGYALCALVLTGGIMTAMSGCASGSRAEREDEIVTLRMQIGELKKSQEAGAQTLARLSGEMKALDAQSAFLVGEVKAAGDDLARIRTALEESNNTIRALRSSVEELSKPAPAVAPSTLAKPAAPSSAPEATPEQVYAAAMASFQAEEHGQAVLGWRELTKRFPEHPLASNAQYWIGEAYYRQKDFSEALLEYRKVIDGYPKSPQLPEALLKIGLCHRAVKNTARAREIWEQLTKEYPGTNAAAQARSLLAAPPMPARPARP
jgi:tol-pal system protein YbgF